ncbi:helix-turn-helix transcriptional regulator [bacterium]|nr:helix-turn-helix transcriptional regulator [bacterium]
MARQMGRDGVARRPPSVIPVRVARGFVGAVTAWAWLVAFLFVGNATVSDGDLSELRHLPQLVSLAGCAAALVAIGRVVHAGGRGPEPSARVAVGASIAVAVAIVVVRATPWAGAAALPLELALWCLNGVGAAYALRRTLLLADALVEGGYFRGHVALGGTVVILAALVAVLLVRMDADAAAAALAALVPVSLALLPQGRPVVGLRDAGAVGVAPSAGRDARARRGERTARIVALGVAAFASGLHTAFADTLYVGGAATASALLTMCLAGVACVWGGPRVPPALARSGAQALLSAQAVAFAPLLVLSCDPASVGWLVCQDALLLISVCALVVLFGALLGHGARAGAAFVGLATLTIALEAGRAAGRVLEVVGGLDGVPPRVAIVCAMAALVIAAVALAACDVDGPRGALPLADGGADERAPRATEGAPAGRAVPTAGADVMAVGAGIAPAGRTVPTEGEAVAHPGGVVAHAGLTPLDRVAITHGLSERERDLLPMVVQGRSIKDIADELVVSRNTVKSHLSHVYAKFGVHAREELMAALADAGVQVPSASPRSDPRDPSAPISGRQAV